MIKVYLSGRLGNQLFQIAFAFLLKQKTGQLIVCRVKPNSQFGYWLADMKTPVFFDSLHTKLRSYLHGMLFRIITEDYVLKNYSCLEEVPVPETMWKHILLDGYFQDARELLPIKSELCKRLRLKKRYEKIFTRKYGNLLEGNTLVVNLRLREYQNYFFDEIKSTPYINPSWYYKIIDKLDLSSFKSKIVISDDVDHAKCFLDRLNQNFTFVDDDWRTDFQFLLHGDTMIIPNSSFSWWGAFLNPNPNKIVYAPKNWVGNNAGVEYPKGIMIDDFNWV